MSIFIRVGKRIINLDRISSIGRIESKEYGNSTTVEMGDPSQTYTVDGPEGELLWQYFCENAVQLSGLSAQTSAAPPGARPTKGRRGR